MNTIKIAAALTLLSLTAQAQHDFTIKAKTGTSDAPGKAYLLYKNERDIHTDSATLHHGAFEFKGTLKEPTLARLIVDHKGIGFAKTTRSADMIMMYLEPGTIHINAADSVKKAKITGSPINDEFTRYQQFVGDAKDDALQAKQLAFIKANPDSYVSLYTLRSLAAPVIDVPVIEPLFNHLSKRLRETVTGRDFKTAINKKKALAVGNLAPEFTQNDVNDKPVKLTDFRGKYVLVDFWASWCGPCRAENPHVVKAYNDYKDKNFTVLSVSLDRPGDKDKWLAAIKKDGLSAWTHVSDLQFWDNAVAQLYGIRSIPQNFLLDKDGRILAVDLRGDALEEALAKVLQ